ncbi:MAG: Na+/H+ antiporter NhaC family protein [Lentisphaerae bacterium]|nr:Na+/H+ antiporter NhaC family protein [Lentisphaerota bacterium]
MNGQNLVPDREPRFRALIPFFVFLIFYLGISIWANDFYFVPMPVAFIVASAAALLQDHKRSLNDKVEIYARGMGDGNIMIMCLIFILAGAFGSIAGAMGAVDATVLAARHLIPDSLILPGFFLISCFISLAIGTSCGTIAALTPIAIGLVNAMGIPPALMVGTVIGGAMFGDNMSMISDTTIAATRTQRVAMKDKFFMNLKISLPAAFAAVILYWFTGRAYTSSPDLPAISWQQIILILPYVSILIGALVGLNVMGLLFLGTVIAAVIGLATGNLTCAAALKQTGAGTLGMAETLIVAILAGGLLGIIRHNGGISYLLMKIEKMISGKRGCELGIALLVGMVNLFTANNTVAIVISGPIAKVLSDKYRCDGRRIASILDTMSCVVQGLIPYGAQILIAIGVAKNAGIELASFDLIKYLFYPMLLALALFLSIVLAGAFRKKEAEK